MCPRSYSKHLGKLQRTEETAIRTLWCSCSNNRVSYTTISMLYTSIKKVLEGCQRDGGKGEVEQDKGIRSTGVDSSFKLCGQGRPHYSIRS